MANFEQDIYFVQPYQFDDEVNEPLPNSVIYTPQFKSLKDAIKEAAELLREPLASTELKNPIIEGLKAEIEKRMRASFPDEIVFAIAGDMKAGKNRLYTMLTREPC